ASFILHPSSFRNHMNDTLSRLRQLWLETTRTNQVMIASALAAALVVAVAFVFWASSPDYATLVSNTTPENANKIIAHLKETKIPYRAANGSIDVPAGQKDELL